MLYDRIALKRHAYTATRAETVTERQNIGFFVWMLMGPQTPLRQRQEFADALKQCLRMQDAHSDTDTSTTINSVNDKISNSEEEKTSITMSIARLDGGTSWQHLHLHLQLRNYRLRNGEKWWWFRVSWKGVPENRRRGADITPINTAHTTQHRCLFTSAERIARAWLKICITSLCALEKSLSSGPQMSHPLLLSSPAVLPTSTSSSSLTLPSTHNTKNTHCNRDNTIYSKNTQYIMNLPGSPSRQAAPSRITLAWKVAETCARHSPHLVSKLDASGVRLPRFTIPWGFAGGLVTFETQNSTNFSQSWGETSKNGNYCALRVSGRWFGEMAKHRPASGVTHACDVALLLRVFFTFFGRVRLRTLLLPPLPPPSPPMRATHK